MDFDGFKGLTDALGGVEVNVKGPFSPSTLTGLAFNAGKQTLNGTESWAFVRERKSFPNNGYTRRREPAALPQSGHQQDDLQGDLAEPGDNQQHCRSHFHRL